jgi:DNA topoisomerase-1
MPKKSKKTREEILAENFFPVEPENIKHSVEKPYKKPKIEDLIKVEKKGKIKAKKASKTKRTTKKSKTKKKTEYIPPKISLKKDGYELIITEKPQAALKIASALGKANKKTIKSVPYYEVTRNKKKMVVACAVGHLFTLKQDSSGSKIPVFDISWVPNSLVRKKDFSKKYYDVLLNLIKNAGSLTVATDYDIEGELIGLNVVRFLGNQKDASRMKFSTLTDKELNSSYEKKASSLDWGQAIAGETRHYLDWFYGINISRALMNALREIGKFKIMSMGRVQGPALNLIVQKEKQILNFKPQPYWQPSIILEKPKIKLRSNRDIFKKSELKQFENLKGKIADVSTEKKIQKIPPNPPFNLTVLQTEAYRIFGITPARTLQLAQNLYLSGLISYPRTSSQKLPSSIGYRDILKKLSKKYSVEKLITRKTPVEGKKSDPAHPSIYPTGNFRKINEEERKIYDLIVKRFLALFMDEATIENKMIKAIVGSEGSSLLFSKKGSSILKKAWMEIYPIKMQEAKIPEINGKIKIMEVEIEEKETQPPKRYSPASIVSELERRNLGTKATRSSILETLYDRGYIQDSSIRATPLGISLIETLEQHSPVIIDEALTRTLEREMDSIQTAKKDYFEKEKKIIEGAKNTITKISEQFKKEEKEIGKELAEANSKLVEQQRKENEIVLCPLCGKGKLAITYSKKNRRYFVACNAYPKCRNTYSLPPNALIKTTDKQCEKCDWPFLIAIRKAKRPWIFCFNPECETNRERLEKYRNQQRGNNHNS